MKRQYPLILLILILNTTSIFSSDEKCKKISSVKKPQDDDAAIKEYILCDYDTKERPSSNNEATNLTLVLVPENIYFSEYSSYLTVEATIVLKWTDENLSWNRQDYNNTYKIILTTAEIWTPDLSIYNRGPYGDKELIQKDETCSVYNTKKVICAFKSSITSMCAPDLRHWPYDSQNCIMKIGSWYHTGSEISYTMVKAKKDMSLYYQENTDWILKSLDITIDPGIYPEIPNDTFPTLNFQVVISRRLANWFVVIVLPFLVLITMTLLTLCRDPMSSDRIYFSVLNIPCHIMLLLNNSWEIPDSGENVPYLLLYLRNSNVLASVILIETLIVRHLLEKQNDGPTWLITFVTKILNNRAGKFLILESDSKDIDEDTATSSNNIEYIEAKPKYNNWHLLGKIIDSLFFIIAIILYIISFLIVVI